MAEESKPVRYAIFKEDHCMWIAPENWMRSPITPQWKERKSGAKRGQSPVWQGFTKQDEADALMILEALNSRQQQPIDMLLFCPKCSTQHVDKANPGVCETCGNGKEDCTCATFTEWLNPSHKSHRCNACNHVWRPADVPTNGVAALQTKGERDGSPIPGNR